VKVTVGSFKTALVMHSLMFLEQAGVDLNNLQPLDIVMPVNPSYTAQEWKEIYAAQLPRPEDNYNYKLGTEPQPGKDLLHTFQ
jgi:hypothetical protein